MAEAIRRIARQALPPRHRARAWRHDALAVRRDLRGALPDAGLRLSRRRGGRGALQGRGSGLRLFALRQSDRRHVRGAHVPARRRGGEPRGGERHGGGDRLAALRSEGRRPRRLLARALRLLRLRDREFPAAPRHLLDARRRPRPRCMAKGGPAGDAGLLPRKPVQPDARADRHRRRRRDRAQGRRAARRRQRLLHAALPAAAASSARTPSSIPPPSTSTARAAASAASCSPTRNGWRRSSSPI